MQRSRGRAKPGWCDRLQPRSLSVPCVPLAHTPNPVGVLSPPERQSLLRLSSAPDAVGLDVALLCMDRLFDQTPSGMPEEQLHVPGSAPPDTVLQMIFKHMK